MRGLNYRTSTSSAGFVQCIDSLLLQLELRRLNEIAKLLHCCGADDRRCDAGLMKKPGQRHLRGVGFGFLPDFIQRLENAKAALIQILVLDGLTAWAFVDVGLRAILAAEKAAG
jgi:hypothetical protein